MEKLLKNKKFFLLPLSFFYGIGVGVRNWLFDAGILRSQKYEIPVISVGNITVGGTGKTPHAEYLLSLLEPLYKIALLSRGYKRKTENFILADNTSSCLTIGDEAFQIKQKYPNILVAVDKDRRNGIKQLLNLPEETRPEIIILDDAYQHRYVNPGINILLINYNRLISCDFLLPAGRLREPARNKDRANIVIVTKCPEKAKPMDFRIVMKNLNLYPYQNLYFTKYIYGDIKPVFPAKLSVKKTYSITPKTNILLVTGIVSNDDLLQYLQSFTQKVCAVKYPDHHYFNDNDLQNITRKFDELCCDDKIILVTEKDAARLMDNPHVSSDLKPYIYSIPIKVSFLLEQEKTFNHQILDYVRKNQTNHRIFAR